MKTHKSHATKRETVCGIEYDSVKEMAVFIRKYLAGSWKRVTCKNCHSRREYYEKRVNRKPNGGWEGWKKEN